MNEPIATTDAGRVRGVDLGGALAFKGLRYAAPPTGARRFLAPAPVEPWSDVFDASALGPSCPQPQTRPAGWTHETLEDEDCLRLNVWTPALDGKRPVLVWFHGGGYTIGSGSWPVYDGAALTRRGDVVVITVNHRLGPLGYAHLADFGGKELAASGNAGMLDLLASLQWVQRNAASFGGDPSNVMIFGESGGGAKVSTLLAMPAAKGLFHRAVVQSGPGRYVLSAEQAKEQTQRFLKKLGIAEGPGAVDALRKLPASALVEASGGRDAMNTGGARGFAPVLDGEVIPLHPAQALEGGAAPDVPLLIGTNFDEATMFLGADPALTDPSKLSFEDLPERLRMYGDRAAKLIAAYRKSRPEGTPLDILLAINTDAMMRVPSIKLAEKKLAGPGKTPVFMYLFCWSAGPLRSAHGFELAFMFDNVRAPVMHASPSREQLAERMSEAWLAFAKTGDPNHDGLPRWRPYDAATRATMIFDRGECELRDDPWGEERAAWSR